MNNANVTTLNPSAGAAMPKDLTLKGSNIYKMALAVMDYKEEHPSADDRSKVKALVMGFQQNLKGICPSFTRFKDENFGVYCDSGRDGEYFRPIEECHRCLFLTDDHSLSKSQLAQVIAYKDFIPVQAIVEAQWDFRRNDVFQPYVEAAELSKAYHLAENGGDPAELQRSLQVALNKLAQAQTAPEAPSVSA